MQGLIDCSAELKELVAPGGEEDLFRTSSEMNFDMIEEEDILDSDGNGLDYHLHHNASSPSACVSSCLFLSSFSLERRMWPSCASHTSCWLSN